MSGYGLPVKFEAVFAALNAHHVRYLVAGGVAVVLHGYVRLTADLDLVVDLAEKQAAAAIVALSELGLRPRLPVDAKLFADPKIRQQWVRDRGMRVFTMHDPADPLVAVDLFADPPGDFEELWRRGEDVPLETVTVKVVSVDDLIAMKREAGRPKDLLDIAELERLRELRRASE